MSSSKSWSCVFFFLAVELRWPSSWARNRKFWAQRSIMSQQIPCRTLSTWVFQPINVSPSITPSSNSTEAEVVSRGSRNGIEVIENMDWNSSPYVDLSLPMDDACFGHLFHVNTVKPSKKLASPIHLRSIRTMTIGRAPASDVYLFPSIPS